MGILYKKTKLREYFLVVEKQLKIVLTISMEIVIGHLKKVKHSKIKNVVYPVWCSVFILNIFFTNCTNTKQSVYFSHSKDTLFLINQSNNEPLIQKNDILSIRISSLNADASEIFNAPNILATTTTTSTGSTQAGGYLVDMDGHIQLPILGNIQAAGLNKKQLKNEITDLIIKKKLLIDPIVTIRHLNYEVTIIGEVGKPSVINVPNEKISLLKALGIAGDITVYGKKNNVLIIRETEGERTIKKLDLNTKAFLHSEYYYLKPNDIIYVEANKQKINAANRNQQLLPTILSGLSIIAFVVTQLIK